MGLNGGQTTWISFKRMMHRIYLTHFCIYERSTGVLFSRKSYSIKRQCLTQCYSTSLYSATNVNKPKIQLCTCSREALTEVFNHEDVGKSSQDENFDPKHFVQVFDNLSESIFRKELSKFPWLHKKFSFATAQLHFYRDRSCYLTPEYNKLLQSLECSIDKLDAGSLASILHSIIFTGVPYTNSVVTRILEKLMDKNCVLTWSDLDNINSACQYLPNYLLFQCRIMIPRYSNLLNTCKDNEDVRSAEDFSSLLGCMNDSVALLSQDLLRKFTHKIYSLMSDSEILNQYSVLNKINKVGARLFFKTPMTVIEDDVFLKWEEIQEKTLPLVLALADDIPCYDYTNLLLSIKQSIFYFYGNRKLFQNLNDVQEVMVQKCVVHLKKAEHDLTIADLSYIIGPLFFNNSVATMPEIANILKRLLVDKLKDSDVILMNLICAYLHIVGYYEKQVVAEVESFCLKHFDEIMEFYAKLSCFIDIRGSSILKFLTEMPSQNEDFKLQMKDRMTDLLKSSHLYCIDQTFRVCGFLIPNCYTHGSLPIFVLNRLKEQMPQAGHKNLQYLMYSFNKVHEPRTMEFHTDFQSISEDVMKRAKVVLKEQRSFRLAIEVLEFSYFHRSPILRYNSEEISEILKYIPEWMSNITLMNVTFSLNYLKDFNFYDESMLYSFEEYVIKCKENIRMHYLYRISSLMFQMGYEPKHEEFWKILIEKLEEEFDGLLPYQQILCVLLLCKYEIYLQKFISKIFSLEYLQKLDIWLQENKENKITCTLTERKLMMLNRYLVIECPELRVPWIMQNLRYNNRKKESISDKLDRLVTFHMLYDTEAASSNAMWVKQRKKKYRDYIVFESSHRKKVFRNRFEPVLADLVGPQSYRRAVVLPYYYTADFDMYTTAKGLPMDYDVAKNIVDPTVKRFVFILMTANDYCFNSIRKLASKEMKIRHLQILGYNVVEIPIYEWDSALHYTKRDKMKYLQRRIYELL